MYLVISLLKIFYVNFPFPSITFGKKILVTNSKQQRITEIKSPKSVHKIADIVGNTSLVSLIAQLEDNLNEFFERHKWVTSKTIIIKSKCLESKHVRYSRNFNYKTYGNLIISPLIVITITTFSVYLLQLITNTDSLIHQKFLILKFCHKHQ